MPRTNDINEAMHDRLTSIAFLKEISADHQDFDRAEIVATLGDRLITLGRDPSCEIAINLNLYGAVSRRHAEIRPVANKNFQGWEICDLDSANGTFINDRRLYGCYVLNHGDRIQLTKDGPIFRFELESSHDTTIGTNYNRHPRSQITSITFTKLLPIFSTENDLWKKAYLLPGMATVGFVVMMFAFLGQPQLFNLTISVYISLAAYYFVYQLCGKNKPWWVILGAAIFTAIILRSPILNLFLWFFYKVLPGTAPTGQVNFISVLTGFIQYGVFAVSLYNGAPMNQRAFFKI